MKPTVFNAGDQRSSFYALDRTQDEPMPHDTKSILTASRKFLQSTKFACGATGRTQTRQAKPIRSPQFIAAARAKSILHASWRFLAKSATDAGGVWRTTEDGNKIFIESGGDVRAGGPSGPVVAEAEPKKAKPAKRKPRKKKEVDPDSPFEPRTKVDRAIVDYIGDDRELVERFRPFVDEAHSFLAEKYLGDRHSAMEVLTQFGYNGAKASGFIGALRYKNDHTNIPRFDEMAEYAVRYHPEMLDMETGESAGENDFEQAFFNRLKRGFPNAPGKHSEEVMNLASQMAGPGIFGESIMSDYDRQLAIEVEDVEF